LNFFSQISSARSDLQSECNIANHSDYKSERASWVLDASVMGVRCEHQGCWKLSIDYQRLVRRTTCD